jgi:tetratricopeptide (TPR) repeat protein
MAGREVLVKALVLLVLLSGCSFFKSLVSDGGEAEVAAADAALQAGDLPEAANRYEAALVENPTNMAAATGAAAMALMRGDTARAESILEAIQPFAEGNEAEVFLRRAIVAQRAGDFDKVWQFGKASQLPAGLLLAGEAMLAEGERANARELLASVTGNLETTAQAYITLIDNPDPIIAGLSEAQALWSLGARSVAVRSVGDLLPRYPEDRPDRDRLLLTWASRAASVGESTIGMALLDSMKGLPQGQRWRKRATRAIVHCSAGRAVKCVKILESLEGTIRADALADARVTAAMVIAEKDPKTARALAGRYRSNAAARALYAAGYRKAAEAAALDGSYRNFLKAGG